MTLTEHEAKKKEQHNCCAICGRSFNEYIAFQDHDHLCCAKKLKAYCGKCNRGLLCFICNKKVVGALEYMYKLKVDPELALSYMRLWSRQLTLNGAYEEKKKRTPKKKKGV